MPDTIDGGNVDTVGDRVAPLDRPPSVVLRRSLSLAFGGNPADCAGIEQDLGPA